ncbi:hypothetical protein GCM10009530_77180 [Microbispora corallina]|uniref:Transcriptional regulator SbtR-like C-terminal domain-containing protein n=1 Tax=Microbispora corallina TaxID=83302 RepID=A0ABQ4GCD6_9ACTN|nr:hypothetical protein Mco01_77500 [Microbispora corallina]
MGGTCGAGGGPGSASTSSWLPASPSTTARSWHSRRQDSALITAAHEAVDAPGTALLDAAKQAGEVRADLRMADLLALLNAIATAAESGERQPTDRLLPTTGRPDPWPGP